MSKLWQTTSDLDTIIEKFTVGNDPLLDLEFVTQDVSASYAHAKMLQKIGILTEKELTLLEK